MSARARERRGSRSVEPRMQRPSHPLRILVVENDADTRTYFTLYLRQLGHHADAVSGVGEALATLEHARYDVLFADIGLADGSGWDLMRLVKEREVACPRYAVAMTGYGLPEDRARSEAAGFRHHLLKPFSPSELKAILDEAGREALAAH